MSRQIITNELHQRRMYIRRHNGLLGTIGIIRAHLKVLDRQESLTFECQRLVEKLRRDADLLYEETYTYRREQDGSVVIPEHSPNRNRKEPSNPYGSNVRAPAPGEGE